MALYDNEEEKKRRAGEKESFLRRAASKTIPGRIATAGRSVMDFARQGGAEASKEKTLAGKAGSLARTAVTLPVAAMAPMAEEAAQQASSVYRGAKAFGRAFTGGDQTATSPATTAPISRVAAPQQGTTMARTQPGQELDTQAGTSPSRTPLERLRGAVGSGSGVPGTGYIVAKGRGAVAMEPGGRITRTGTTVSDPLEQEAQAIAPSPSRSRMYTYGGFKAPDRSQQAAEQVSRRVSDIPEPATIGAVPGYRRQVQALQADIDTEQQQAQRAQQQGQFEERQAQQQGQFEAGQAQQQGQFGMSTALKAQELAREGERQQADMKLKEASLELKQKAEASRQKQQDRLDEAIGSFSGAQTPQERRKAAEMINVLSGKGLKSEKSAAPAWKPAEVSAAVGDFEKRFSQASMEGQIEPGASLQRTMFARDPGLYQAAYGNLSPQAAEFGERLLTYPLDKLKADEKFKAMLESTGGAVTAEELRAKLISDYYNLSQGR